MDGITLSANDTLLVKNESSGLKNGLYTVTTVGDGSNPYVLTRIAALNTDGEFYNGHLVYVKAGTVNAQRLFANTNLTAVTLGTTAVTYDMVVAKETYAISFTFTTNVESQRVPVPYNIIFTEIIEEGTGAWQLNKDGSSQDTGTGDESGLALSFTKGDAVSVTSSSVTGTYTVTWIGYRV